MISQEKLLIYFKKERQRIENQIFNPIIDVINNPDKYKEFYEYFLITNINVEIIKDGDKVNTLSFTDHYQALSLLDEEIYRYYKEKVETRILNLINFDPFKIVFGEQSYKEWVLSFFKYILYSYFLAKDKLNIREQIITHTFDPLEFKLDNILKDISAIIFKVIMGYNQTAIDTFEYWERTASITKKTYYSLLNIVNNINPGTVLLNSFLYFTSPLKNNVFKGNTFHEYKTFETSNQAVLSDPIIAKEWILNYFAALTLQSKLQVGLWKAVRDLTFGKTVGGSTQAKRTLTELTVNLSQEWSLSKDALKFFNSLKFQGLLNLNVPKTFIEFLSQNSQNVEKLTISYKNKFKQLNNKISNSK